MQSISQHRFHEIIAMVVQCAVIALYMPVASAAVNSGGTNALSDCPDCTCQMVFRGHWTCKDKNGNNWTCLEDKKQCVQMRPSRPPTKVKPPLAPTTPQKVPLQ